MTSCTLKFKKYISNFIKPFLFLIFIISIRAFPQGELIYSFSGKNFNDSLQVMVPCNLQFRYDLQNDILFFIIREKNGLASYMFNSVERDSVKLAINKYFEWEQKAEEVDLEIAKSITTIQIPVYFQQFISKKGYTNGGGIMEMYFLSQDVGWHQLVLKFRKIQSREKPDEAYKPKHVYLNKKNILKLKEGFNNDYLKSFRKKTEIQKNIEEQFK